MIPVIYIHLGTLVLTAGIILAADSTAVAWLRGKRDTVSARSLALLHGAVWAGLATMIASGAYLMWPMREYLVQDIAFWVKMFFVLVLVVNSFFIGALMRHATTTPFRALSQGQQRHVFLSGGASAIGWIGAVIAALIMSPSGWVVYLLGKVGELF